MATSTVVDMEKLHLPSFESHSNSVAADRSLTYLESIDQISEASFRSTLATETITSEEAVIAAAAAAAEAVALAKAALEGAKDSALMGGYYPSASFDCKSSRSSAEADNFRFDISTEMERTVDLHSLEAENIPEGEHSTSISINDDDCLDPTDKELKLLQMQFSESIAVRSGRQTERKAKRAKAAEKSASSVISVNTGSSKRKKRAPVREVDFSDPLHYLRGTTSGSRLLTGAQELELSAGVQDLDVVEALIQGLVLFQGGVLMGLVQW